MAETLEPRLLEAALSHFAAGGVDATTLDAVADAAGLPLADLAARFRSVDELFLASMVAATHELLAELQQLAKGDDAAIDALAEVTRRIATPTPIERRAMFTLLRELLDGSPRLEVLYPQLLQPAVQTLIDLIGRAEFQGELTPLPPRFVLVLLLCGVALPQLASFGAVEGMLQGVHAPPDDDPSQAQGALLAACLQGVFRGLIPRADPAP
jgi:AcrR family transcriptional regulator